MSLIFAIEALKFHRLRAERLLRLLFVVVLAINLLHAFAPIGSRDFSALLLWSERLLREPLVAPAPGQPPALSSGNLIYLASFLLLGGINWLASFAYAACYSAERDGLPAERGLRLYLRRLGPVIALLLLMVVPFLLSVLAFMVPVILLALALCLAPVLIAEEGMGLRAAIATSVARTRGKRGLIFLSMALLSILYSGIESLLSNLVGRRGAALYVIVAFIATIYALARGRLLGMLHQFSRLYPHGLPRRGGSPNDALRLVGEITGRELKAPEDED